MEGYRQLDELDMLSARLPNGFNTLLRPGTEKAVQAGLSNIQALVLLAVGLQASVQQVLDSITYTESIITLLEIRLITAE